MAKVEEVGAYFAELEKRVTRLEKLFDGLKPSRVHCENGSLGDGNQGGAKRIELGYKPRQVAVFGQGVVRNPNMEGGSDVYIQGQGSYVVICVE